MPVVPVRSSMSCRDPFKRPTGLADKEALEGLAGLRKHDTSFVVVDRVKVVLELAMCQRRVIDAAIDLSDGDVPDH